jgi:hypothetical protein
VEDIKLKLTYERTDADLKLRIVYQDEALRCCSETEAQQGRDVLFKARNGWVVRSVAHFEVNDMTLYLRGYSSCNDNMTVFVPQGVLHDLAEVVAELNGRKNVMPTEAEKGVIC